jgi:hypothetical protein
MDEVYPFEKLEDGWMFNCPWCGINIFVEKNQINCRMFVCGEYKATGSQVPQHISKEIADSIKTHKVARGCINPFFFDGRVLSKRNYG